MVRLPEYRNDGPVAREQGSFPAPLPLLLLVALADLLERLQVLL